MKLVSNANHVPTMILPIKGLTDENTISWNEYLSRNPKTGLLKVQTTTANGLVPVSDARVIIEKNIGSDSFVIGVFLTDINGQTAMVQLPAPDKSLSLMPSAASPYSFYTIKIMHPNYQDVINFNVPIFEGITSVQPVGMIPRLYFDSSLSPDKVYEPEPEL